MDLDITKDEFINNTIDIYITINYINTEEEAIYLKNLYAVIYGSLIEYRK